MTCPYPDTPPLSALTLRSIHALVSAGLLSSRMWEGALRTHEVRIGGSAYMPPDDPHVIDQAFGLLVEKVGQISDPFEQAFFVTVHLPLLQAFEDCNKRTSRVAANIPLLAAGVSPLSFMDVTQRDYVDGLLGIYELNDFSLAREVFVEAYVKSARRYWSPTVSFCVPPLVIVENTHFLESAVRDLVKHHGGFDRKAAEAMVQEKGLQSRPVLVTEMREMIEGLNEGNLVRYGLGLDDLERLRGDARTLEGCEASGKEGMGSSDEGWTPPEPSPLDDMDDPFRTG